jgi:hypothetical protein
VLKVLLFNVLMESANAADKNPLGPAGRRVRLHPVEISRFPEGGEVAKGGKGDSLKHGEKHS